jgi:hypothetical protein
MATEKCVVCGHADGRALVTTRLLRGEVVVVCGTHELMHRRSGRTAQSAGELRTMLGERRGSRRRMPIPDELGARLIDAFSVTTDRRDRDRDRRS